MRSVSLWGWIGGGIGFWKFWGWSWANLGEMGHFKANFGKMDRLWGNWANYAIFDISNLSTYRFRANLGRMDGLWGQ